ncbi:hypothetical protein VN12_14065 [Pirellula sp. SH-Sr6A]|uniref:hypothetical protein n=1 Tax=Pirellula sp. SH-Sr6A TaxID=1632865 RepID=UPI00078BAB80|nr:hypothetical protein [Pirellula sp. SH-Sr6A]AMV33248.1 hypothetical protein VN12_14065 [Pirellula sp. SH-Sr6A]
MVPLNDATLLAYIEEALPAEQMSELEKRLRHDASIRDRLLQLVAQRDHGVHSIGDIWRRHRLSCPTREEIGSYILGAMNEDRKDYIRFHIEEIGCRFCKSNWEDLSESHHQEAVRARRRKYFQSSVGRIKAEG